MANRQYSPYDLTDMTKLMSEFQVPGIDWQELMASQQKNIAALTKANQLMMEGAQAVLRREVEIMQKAMSELVAAQQDLMKEGDPQAQAQKRFELAKASFETAITNMRELAELASKSNREALEVINKRALESFEEITTTIEKQQRAGASKAGGGAKGGSAA